MTSLTDTQVVTASGGLVELASTSVVDEVFITDSTPSGTANVVPNISVVCDGSPVLVELYSPMAYPDPFSAASWFSLGLVYDGARTGSGNGHWTYMQNDGTGYDINPLHLSMRMTPTAGVHTFGVNGYRNTGTARIGGTTSQRGMDAIQFRVSKIVQASQWPAVTTGTIICTSSTRPASPFEGQKIYETDTDRELTYDSSAWVQTVELGAWTSWTPTVTQGSTTFTLNTNDCAYTRFGKTITAQFRVSIGSGTGQTGQGIVMTLPVTPKSSGGPVYGPVWVYDASGGVGYDGTAFRYGAGVGFIGDWSSNQLMGAVPSLIMTTGDEIRGTVTYEAA